MRFVLVLSSFLILAVFLTLNYWLLAGIRKNESLILAFSISSRPLILSPILKKKAASGKWASTKKYQVARSTNNLSKF